MEVFTEHQSFTFISELVDRENSGGIFDANADRLLAYFRHEHNWRTPRGPVKIWKQARATDIYLESVDGVLFGEINEIPPKLFSMRLIRTFEIYDDRKELVGVVREKPKAVGSDWVLENLDGNIVGVVVGDRKNKEYEIHTPDGQVLVRCFRQVIDKLFGNSTLDMGSYRVDILDDSFDLFLLLGYILVLEFAKVGWSTRGSFLGRYLGKKEVEKEHLLKTREAQIQIDNAQSYERALKYAKRSLFLSIVLASIYFSINTVFLLSGSGSGAFFYGAGIVGLIFAFLGVKNVETKKFNTITILMGIFAMFSAFLLSPAITTMPNLSEEGLFFAILSFIVSLILLFNVQLSMGFWDDFIKKK